MTIHLRIAELRKAQNLSIRQLAKLAGVSPTTIVDLEAGKTGALRVLEHVADALNVDAGYLIVHERKALRRRGQ